jgi:hypothetical protein
MIPYSAADLQQLRTRLRYGSDEEKKEALRQLPRFGKAATDILPAVAEQLTNGLAVPSGEVVDLLESIEPSPDLMAAFARSPKFPSWTVLDKCRLWRLGLGQWEEELCRYLYRSWRKPDPAVGEILSAMREVGTRIAHETLTAVLPEIEELVNANDFFRKRRDVEDATSDEGLMSRSGVYAERLEKTRDAIAAIRARAA